MSEAQQLTSLQAKSPFEMRVNLGRDLPESDVRTALATGDMGFLDPVFALLRGRRDVSFDACIAITPIPGR